MLVDSANEKKWYHGRSVPRRMHVVFVVASAGCSKEFKPFDALDDKTLELQF